MENLSERDKTILRDLPPSCIVGLGLRAPVTASPVGETQNVGGTDWERGAQNVGGTYRKAGGTYRKAASTIELASYVRGTPQTSERKMWVAPVTATPAGETQNVGGTDRSGTDRSGEMDGTCQKAERVGGARRLSERFGAGSEKAPGGLTDRPDAVEMIADPAVAAEMMTDRPGTTMLVRYSDAPVADSRSGYADSTSSGRDSSAESMRSGALGATVGSIAPSASGAPHGSDSPLNRSKQRASGTGPDPHLPLYSRTAFPSARQCAECHRQIYDEWAVSNHAYASISPMFQKFEDTINALSQGTIGYFCMRCHAPVATTMGLRRDQPIWDGPDVFREGVTCVACHRVKTPYTKVNGERRIEPGDIFEPVYGTSDGTGNEIAIKYAEYFKTLSQRDARTPGQPIHQRAIQFEELSESTFCMSCHQVAVQPGIKLEVVWDQYRASPACREGISCQDCHMGKQPGVASGYTVGPAAVVNDRVVNPERRHSNHVFYGPGYSIAHPGIFPMGVEPDRWSVNEWLMFDWRSGWGTDEFEDAVAEGRVRVSFPAPWDDVDARYDAREIVDANLRKLQYKKDLRRMLMENGSRLDGPFFDDPPTCGQPLVFHYKLKNLNRGHNMPSGSLGAQPQLWVNVVLIGPDGRRLWESGDLDSNGDLRDAHSWDVLDRRLPLDAQLVNLQTRFLTTNVKGTDREMYLPINVDVDQLPFLRPAIQPVSVLNHPPFIRMESRSLPPLGSRNAKFVIPAELITQPGTYRLSVRMRSRAEPIYFMRFVGATPEMERMMNEWICDFHASSVVFEVR